MKYFELGARLKLLRTQQNISQRTLAEEEGFSRAAIADWEQGVSYPDYRHIVRLVKRFKCDAHWLVTGLTFDAFLDVVE